MAVNILGAGLSRKYRNSDFPYVQMQNLIETNSAGKDKWRLPSPMYEIEGYPWLPSSLNFEKAFHESESRNEMLHSAPSYPTISLGGAVSTASHGNLSNSGTFSSEVKGLELVTAQGDILLVDEFSPLMPVMSCALGGGAMIRSIKLKTYQDQIFHVKKRLMELDEFLTSFDHLTSSHLSVFVNLFYHRGIPRFLVSQIDKEILGLNQNKDSELISKLEVFGVKSSKFIPSSVKNSLRYFVTKKFNPDYRVFGNSIHHALKTDTTEKRGFQRFEISSHEVCFPFEMHQELILSLVEELSKKWLELDSFYPINLRISGADEAFLSPSFGRKSLWVDFVMQDSKEMSLLREFETWHIVNNFGGRPHFGKYMNPERYDFSSLYSNLNLFVETINSLDPKGFFNSVLLEHV